MTEEPDKQPDPEASIETAPAEPTPVGDGQSETELGQLMQPEDNESRLEATAMAAAAQLAVEEGERALRTAADALRTAEGISDPPSPEPPPRKHAVWILRGLLILNLAMMGLMIALPSDPNGSPASVGGHDPSNIAQPEEHQPATGSHGEVVDPAATRPFVKPLRAPGLGLPRDELYTNALLVAAKGNFTEAVLLLKSYLAAHPNLSDPLRSLVCGNISFYLRKDGRGSEAVEYDIQYAKLANSHSLPEDLWRMAIAAEQRGDGLEMRRAYARLLLQQKVISPTLKALVSEAYLKLGDSYRIEAEHGAGAAREADQRRLEGIKALRSWQPDDGSKGH